MATNTQCSMENKQTELSAATHNMTAATTMAIEMLKTRTRTWAARKL